MSLYLVCYIVNTAFGKKELYKHFNTLSELFCFIDSKKNDCCVLDIYVYKNIERFKYE